MLVVKSAPGKSPHLSPEALAGLQERLEQPPGFKSYGEIVEWLNQTYQLNLTYPTVYNWVHYRLKAKLKVPRPQSAKQEPNAGVLKKHCPSPVDLSTPVWKGTTVALFVSRRDSLGTQNRNRESDYGVWGETLRTSNLEA